MSDSVPTPCPFLIRDAVFSDLPLIRDWLPGTLRGTPAAVFAIATDAKTGVAAGVASLRLFCDAVGRFRVFVAPTFRRRGCGTLLLDWIRQAALRARAAALLSGASYEVEPSDEVGASALAFFRARGLSVALDILRYRAELAAALALLEPLYQRGQRGPENAHGARIVTVDQVDPHALADFVVRHVGGFPEDVVARLSGGDQGYSLALSMTALIDTRIVGVLLHVAQGQNTLIETRAVEVGHRGGWVNLALLYRSATAGARLGIKTSEFEGDIGDHDTTKLARRLGATLVGRRQCWGCTLPGTAPATPPQR